MQVLAEPLRLFRNVDKTVFNSAGDRCTRMILSIVGSYFLIFVHSLTDQFLNQLRARTPDLRSRWSQVETPLACSRTARFNSGYPRRFREHMKKVNVLFLHAPGRADAEIT